MQHLPFLPQKEIPYLGGPIYIGEGLAAFLKHRGWTPDSLLDKINLEDKSPRSKLAFLQSLLNIAVLIDFLAIRDVRVKYQTFIGHGSILDTSGLPGYVESMAKNGAGLSPAIKQQQAIRAHELFEFAKSCTLDEIWRNKNEVTLGIVCMIVTISKLARILEIVPKTTRLKVGGQGGQHGRPIELLLQTGWCPRQVAELYSLTNPLSLYYVTTLKREHRIGSHTACTPSKCISSKVDSETYKTSHTTTCAGCDHVSVDIGEVIKLIAQGVVPRLSVKVPSDGTLQARPVLCVTGVGPYAAISHVWAHGLGNPFKNSLPACQLWRLQSLAEDAMQQISSDHTVGKFWVDTLCVPLDKGPRKQALTLLRKTFHEASCTVVLDHEIEQLSMHDPGYEIAWRLSVSDWARRLWTYEEFVVSGDRVLVKFKDGLLNVAQKFQLLNPHMYQEAPKAEGSYKYDPYHILNVPAQMLQNVQFQNKSPKTHPHFFLSALVDHTSNLCTTRWEDEALCLASVMDIETKTLAALPGEDRMETLLSQIQTLPTQILFGNGYRLQKPGLRWAPRTFLVDHRFPESDEMLAIHFGQYRTIPEYGVLMGFATVLGGYDLTRCASQIRRDVLLKLPGPNPPLRFLRYIDKLENPGAWWLEWTLRRHDVDDGPNFMPEQYPPQGLKLIVLRKDLLGPAILVQSLGTRGGTERVKFLTRIDVNRILDPNKSWDEVNWLRWEKGEVVHAVTIPTGHRWFIT